MARFIASAFCLGLAASSACATTNASNEGRTHTTSTNVQRKCADEDATCVVHEECCSARCDNGVCVREEP